MKVPVPQLDSFISDNNSYRKSIAMLIYGAETGLAAQRVKAARERFLLKNNGAEVLRIDAMEPDFSSQMVVNHYLSPSLFATNTLIIIDNVAGNVNAAHEAAKELALLYKKGNINESNFVIFSSMDELDSRSKLRMIFEKEDCFATIPCYVDDEPVTKNLIRNQLMAMQIIFNDNHLNEIVRRLHGNRLNIENELEKLNFYLVGIGKKELNEDIINLVISDVSEVTIFQFINDLFDREIGKIEQGLRKMQNEEVSVISIIYMMVDYAGKLENIMIKSPSKAKQLEVIAAEIPFFKQRKITENHLKFWDMRKLAQFKGEMYDLETIIKTRNMGDFGYVMMEKIALGFAR